MIICYFHSGAKREGETVNFLVKFNEQDPKIVELSEMEKFPISIIQYLEAKIEWDDASEDNTCPGSNVLVEARKATGKFICKYCEFVK